MGTDIHLLVERRVGGKWELVTPRTLQLEKKLKKHLPKDRETVMRAVYAAAALEIFSDDEAHYSSRCFYDDRDYGTFGCLAGVRTPPRIDSCAPPRGLPEDMSEEARALYSGDHDPSWLSLRELLDYDWKGNYPRDDYTPLFVTEFIPRLKKIAPPDDVRIVFGFDS